MPSNRRKFLYAAGALTVLGAGEKYLSWLENGTNREELLKATRPKTYGQAIGAIYEDQGASRKNRIIFDAEYTQQLVSHYSPVFTGPLHLKGHSHTHNVTVVAGDIDRTEGDKLVKTPYVAIYVNRKDYKDPSPAISEENRFGTATLLNSSLTASEIYQKAETPQKQSGEYSGGQC